MNAPHPEAALVQDVVDANRILFHQGIVDAFGHVSARSAVNPQRFFLSRNLAPGLVTGADVLEYDVATGEPVCADTPRQYLERTIHSEIFKARPDVMAVVHHHSPAVLPFTIAKGAPLKPVCHMCGFLGAGPPLFELRDTAGAATDLLISNRELGAALARALGAAQVVLMRGHGCTVVGKRVRIAFIGRSTPRSTRGCCCRRGRWARWHRSPRKRPKPHAPRLKGRSSALGSCGASRPMQPAPRLLTCEPARWPALHIQHSIGTTAAPAPP